MVSIFTLSKQSQRSRSILQDGSRSLGLFWKEKTLSYNQRNTVFVILLEGKKPVVSHNTKFIFLDDLFFTRNKRSHPFLWKNKCKIRLTLTDRKTEQNLWDCFGRESPLYSRIFITLKCLSIGTSKTINFPFVPNGELMFFLMSQYLSSIYLGCNVPKFWDT